MLLCVYQSSLLCRYSTEISYAMRQWCLTLQFPFRLLMLDVLAALWSTPTRIDVKRKIYTKFQRFVSLAGRTIWSTSLNPFGVGVFHSFTLHQHAGRWSVTKLKPSVRVAAEWADHETRRSSKRWLLQGRSTDSHLIRLIGICTWYFKDYFAHTDIGLSVLRLSFWVSGQCRRSAEESSLDQLQTQGRPDAVTCVTESSSTKFSCTVQASNSAGTPSLLMHPRANESFATQNSCRLASQLRKEGGQGHIVSLSYSSVLRPGWYQRNRNLHAFVMTTSEFHDHRPLFWHTAQ